MTSCDEVVVDVDADADDDEMTTTVAAAMESESPRRYRAQVHSWRPPADSETWTEAWPSRANRIGSKAKTWTSTDVVVVGGDDGGDVAVVVVVADGDVDVTSDYC